MAISTNLLELLACPVTNGALSFSENGLVSADLKHTYPIIDDIPWLLANPQNSLVDWSIKLNHFHQILNSEIIELESEIITSSGATKKRLEQLYKAKHSFIRSIFKLLSPVVRHPMATKNVYDTLTDIAPNTQNLLSYEANLYRDWVWGEEENILSRDIVGSHVDKNHCKKILVLGAGAGRLALDLHQLLSPTITVITDINPLLTLAAKKILDGNNLDIVEFPMEPINSEYVAIEHKIKREKAPDNFHTIFCDANRPAFKKGSFDTVITPWLIDIQPLELSCFLQQLNQYISVGDQWINFGSLVFNQRRDALCYSIEEVKAIALKQGFDIQAIKQQQIPYLKSPYNAGHRIETVWSWSATKVADVNAIEQTPFLPNWLRDISQPVPKADYFKQFNLKHRLYAQLGAEVDGKTSIKKMGSKLSKQYAMDRSEADNLVKHLFIDLFTQNE